MGVSYSIDRAAHRVVLVLTGPMVNDEIDACYATIFADKDFVPGLDLLVDLRGSDDHPTAVQMRERARRSSTLTKRFSGRVAQLFTTNGVQYGMGRMYSVFALEFGITAEAFTSLSDADQWLAELRGTTPPT